MKKEEQLFDDADLVQEAIGADDQEVKPTKKVIRAKTGEGKTRGAETGREPDEETGKESDKVDDRATSQTLWMRPSGWRKLNAAKNGLGLTWGALGEVVVEQLIGAGVLDSECKEEIRKIEAEAGTELDQEPGWRDCVAVRAHWCEAGIWGRI